MTKPSLTYGHGLRFDCDSTTDWNLTNSSVVSPSLTVMEDDIFKLEGTCDDAGNEFFYYERDFAANISSDVYSKYLVRWKTSHSGNGAGAKVTLVFTSGTQDLIGSPTPAFNTSWTVSTGTVTAGKTIDKVRFYWDDYPETVASGTYQVYYDFILICQNIWSFPFISGTEEVELVNNYIYHKVPSRVGNITQYLGAESPIIRVSGKMDYDDNVLLKGWRGSTGLKTYGFDLMTMWKLMHSDPWQWFSSDQINCKVTMPRLVLSKVPDSDAKRLFSIEMRHYGLSSGDNTLWDELSWLGVT